MISVIIPVKDHPGELKRALSSVFRQEGVNAEIVVIENNSEHPDIIRAVVEGFPHENLVFHSLGVCPNANVARNFGVSLSSGEYITYLDADDEYLDGHLKSSLELLNTSGADFLYGSVEVFDGVSSFISVASNLDSSSDGLSYLLGSPRGSAQTNTYFMRRQIFDRVHWDESLSRHQDYDFFIAVSQKFKTVCKVNATVKVNWLKGVRRAYSYEAMRRFYEKWKMLMDPIHKIRYSFDKVKVAFLNRDIFGVLHFLLILLVASSEHVFQKIGFPSKLSRRN